MSSLNRVNRLRAVTEGVSAPPAPAGLTILSLPLPIASVLELGHLSPERRQLEEHFTQLE